MPGATKITDQLTVSGQIALGDIAEIAKQGFAYPYIPVVTGDITRNDVVQFQKAILRDGPAFAHCRSGTRCYLLWGLSRALYDGDSALTLVAEAARKGYDLRVLPALVEKLENEKGT